MPKGYLTPNLPSSSCLRSIPSNPLPLYPPLPAFAASPPSIPQDYRVFVRTRQSTKPSALLFAVCSPLFAADPISNPNLSFAAGLLKRVRVLVLCRSSFPNLAELEFEDCIQSCWRHGWKQWKSGKVDTAAHRRCRRSGRRRAPRRRHGRRSNNSVALKE